MARSRRSHENCDKVGLRVFAVRNSDQDNVYIFGHGTYSGDHQIPGTKKFETFEELGLTDEQIAHHLKFHTEMVENMPWPSWEDWSAQNAAYLREHDGMSDEEIRAFYDEVAAERALPVEEQMKIAMIDVYNGMNLNPRIDLDNGGTVWGFQCWWGPESKFDEMVKGRTVVEVPLP
jgi:hypothetical protein